LERKDRDSRSKRQAEAEKKEQEERATRAAPTQLQMESELGVDSAPEVAVGSYPSERGDRSREAAVGSLSVDPSFTNDLKSFQVKQKKILKDHSKEVKDQALLLEKKAEKFSEKTIKALTQKKPSVLASAQAEVQTASMNGPLEDRSLNSKQIIILISVGFSVGMYIYLTRAKALHDKIFQEELLLEESEI